MYHIHPHRGKSPPFRRNHPAAIVSLEQANEYLLISERSAAATATAAIRSPPLSVPPPRGDPHNGRDGVGEGDVAPGIPVPGDCVRGIELFGVPTRGGDLVSVGGRHVAGDDCAVGDAQGGGRADEEFGDLVHGGTAAAAAAAWD